MSIEEKKKPLEFTFIPDRTTGPEEVIGFDIVYNPDYNSVDNMTKLYPITITNNGQSICCPVELFSEVIEFLIQKGIIEKTVEVPLLNVSTHKTFNLPLTVIDGEGGEAIKQKEVKSTATSTIPFTSFDNKIADVEEVVNDITPAEESADAATIPTIKIGEGEEEVEVVDESIISRPVIRSRIGDSDDPQAAEKEGAVLRGEQESNFRRA